MRTNRYPVSFAFRLDEPTAARLREVAFAYGYQPAEWARRIIYSQIGIQFEQRAVQLRVQNADLLRDFLIELKRQGTNVNQIAAHLNRTKTLDITVLKSELELIRHNLSALTENILDALGASRQP